MKKANLVSFHSKQRKALEDFPVQSFPSDLLLEPIKSHENFPRE
jgi:hypothetical protein